MNSFIISLLLLSTQNSTPPKALTFEVATIKPLAPNEPRMIDINVYPGGRVRLLGFSLKTLIGAAFGLSYWQVSGGEAWTADTIYNVEAKAPENAGITTLNHTIFGIDDPRLREMLQTLLAERFQLKFHRESKTGDVYSLEKGANALLLVASEPPREGAARPELASFGSVGYAGGKWGIFKTSMPQLAKFAADNILHVPVSDRTGLSGLFEYRQRQPDVDPVYGDHPDSFLRMIHDIGLQLVRSKGPVETFVIDSASRPSTN